MKISSRIVITWLLSGPVLALIISFPSWFVIDYLSPGKLHEIQSMISSYPLALIMSMLTPWGWLMYGGIYLMHTSKSRLGIYCTIGGALLLGIFLPVWSVILMSA